MVDTLTVQELEGFGLAAVMARRGADRDRLAKSLGVTQLPDRARFAKGEQIRLLGTGPGTWLALAETAPPDWAGGVMTSLAGQASVSDQSAAYRLFRLRGGGAQTMLQRGLYVDLEPTVFPPGSVAVAGLARMGVVLWRPAPDIFDLAVFRSYAASLTAWMEAVAADLPFSVQWIG